MSALPYVKLYPSDFLAAAAFHPRRLRAIYSYLLIMQADKGAIKESVQKAVARYNNGERVNLSGR